MSMKFVMTEVAGDKAWMEEKDKNYLERIEREVKLRELERAAYYLRLKEHATNSIRDWWTEKLLLPNLSQILEQAEKEATPQAIENIEQEEKIKAEKIRLSTIRDNLQLSSATANIITPSAAAAATLPAVASATKAPDIQLTQFQCILRSELQFIEELGRGNFGVVYKASWHKELVAVKELHTSKLTQDGGAEFVNETETMAKFNYPRIVQLYGICTPPDPYCLVMEYLPQGSLYNVLHSQTKYPWVVSLQISFDIGCGLAFLDSKKIIHRDLKSANVLLDNNFRAKICDFGLAKTRQEVTTVSTKTVLGTPSWKAPETFGIRPKYSSASDMFAFGITMWEILTRKNPYDGADANEIKSAVMQGEREEIPPTCPPKYGALIKGCWAQKPENRRMAKEAVKDLEEQIQEAQLTTMKSWYCDPSVKPKGADTRGYTLIDGTASDKQKVVSAYQCYPVPGMDIKSVTVIYNLEFNRAFNARLVALKGRHNNSAFTAKWDQENEPEWRGKVVMTLDQMAAPNQDPDCPNVKIIATWHGTRPGVVDSICTGGFANLASTDSGFYGKGVYATLEAEYANRVYSEGALIFVFTACYSAYPVIDGDMSKLMGRANYGNYDAHFAPVKPANPLNPNEVNYYPCKPNEPATYHELVVFESAQCLPRYIIELQPSLPKAPNVAACMVVLNIIKATTTCHGSFWHFRCANHNGLTFFGKSRTSREAAEQALKRHQKRKHDGLNEGIIEQTTKNHPKKLC